MTKPDTTPAKPDPVKPSRPGRALGIDEPLAHEHVHARASKAARTCAECGKELATGAPVVYSLKPPRQRLDAWCPSCVAQLRGAR